jgi:hypothetical protein
MQTRYIAKGMHHTALPREGHEYTIENSRQNGAQAYKRAGGGGRERQAGGAAPLRNRSSVPITMACGWVTHALMGLILMLAASRSMVVEEGDANKVSVT